MNRENDVCHRWKVIDFLQTCSAFVSSLGMCSSFLFMSSLQVQHFTHLNCQNKVPLASSKKLVTITTIFFCNNNIEVVRFLKITTTLCCCSVAMLTDGGVIDDDTYIQSKVLEDD